MSTQRTENPRAFRQGSVNDPFIPQPIDLPSIPEATVSWDVRSLANDQGWQWDDELGRYLDEDEQPVTESEILAVVQAELTDLESQVDALSDELLNESIDVKEWEETLAELIVGVAALFFLFGLGDRSKITDEYTEFVETRVRTQYDYLRNFSLEILAGALSGAMIAARSKLYVHDAESNHGYAQDFTHDTDQFPYYSNVLGSVRPCKQCPRETAKGIVPRGSLPNIGNRECNARCHCHFAYYTTADAVQRMSMRGAGWLGQSSIVSSITLPVTHG